MISKIKDKKETEKYEKFPCVECLCYVTCRNKLYNEIEKLNLRNISPDPYTMVDLIYTRMWINLILNCCMFKEFMKTYKARSYDSLYDYKAAVISTISVMFKLNYRIQRRK